METCKQSKRAHNTYPIHLSMINCPRSNQSIWAWSIVLSPRKSSRACRAKMFTWAQSNGPKSKQFMWARSICLSPTNPSEHDQLSWVQPVQVNIMIKCPKSNTARWDWSIFPKSNQSSWAWSIVLSPSSPCQHDLLSQVQAVHVSTTYCLKSK